MSFRKRNRYKRLREIGAPYECLSSDPMILINGRVSFQNLGPWRKALFLTDSESWTCLNNCRWGTGSGLRQSHDTWDALGSKIWYRYPIQNLYQPLCQTRSMKCCNCSVSALESSFRWLPKEYREQIGILTHSPTFRSQRGIVDRREKRWGGGKPNSKFNSMDFTLNYLNWILLYVNILFPSVWSYKNDMNKVF